MKFASAQSISSASMKWQKWTLNFRVAAYCRQLLQERRLPPEEVAKLQVKRLRRVCIAAYEAHAFYRDRFDRCGFNPYRLTAVQDIQVVPVLEKEAYRDFTQRLVTARPERYAHWYRDGTSGSSGRPLPIYRTWDERAYMVAKWMRVLYLNGYRWHDRTFSIPSPLRLRRDSVLQKLGIMVRKSVPYTAPAQEMVQAYCAHRPSVLYANRSQLVQMANHAEKEEISLPHPRLCLSAAETLDAAAKALILKAFSPQRFADVYGAVEFNNLAWQEGGDDYYHFSHSTNLLEVETPGHLSAPLSRAVITDFFIDSFPLIRYNLEDLLEVEETAAAERVIRRIIGRADDWIILADGNRLPFHLFYNILCGQPMIRQFRVIQETLHDIRILLVKEKGADASALQNTLQQQLQRQFPARDVVFYLEWADELLPDPQGKLRVLISHLPQQTTG